MKGSTKERVRLLAVTGIKEVEEVEEVKEVKEVGGAKEGSCGHGAQESCAPTGKAIVARSRSRLRGASRRRSMPKSRAACWLKVCR